jgi:hypothetical protein
MKKHRKENSFLEQLKTIPNVSLACEKVGLSRNTVYRWCNEDPEFKARLDEALENGVESVNDLAESKLVTNINNGNMRAIQYWLDNNKKTYIRPRPKNFWDVLDGPGHIAEIVISPVDPERTRKAQAEKREDAKRKY